MNALIASAAKIGSHWDMFSFDVRGEGTWDLFLLFRLCHLDHVLRGNSLGLAIDDFAAFYGSLDEPMLLVITEVAALDAILAKIEIAIIANDAVPVGVGNRTIAIIAADCKVRTWLRSQRKRALWSSWFVQEARQFGAAVLTSGEIARYGRFSITKLVCSTDIAGVPRCDGIMDDAKGVLGLLLWGFLKDRLCGIRPCRVIGDGPKVRRGLRHLR